MELNPLSLENIVQLANQSCRVCIEGVMKVDNCPYLLPKAKAVLNNNKVGTLRQTNQAIGVLNHFYTLNHLYCSKDAVIGLNRVLRSIWPVDCSKL